MIWNPPNRTTTVSPEEMAAAMRNGLEARRYFRAPGGVKLDELPPLPAPPAGGMLPQLTEAGNVVAFAGPPEGGIKGRAVGLMRSIFKKLTNPWWDRQTRFNLATIDYIEQLHAHVGHLTERVNVLHEVVAGYPKSNARLNEALFDIHQLQQRVAGRVEVTQPPSDGSAPAAARVPKPLDPVQVIEGLFLQTRLAPPPGRGLVLSPHGLHALDLASLGFQVVQFGATPESLHHPELQVVNGKPPAELPFPNESFDFAVALSCDGTPAPGQDLTDARSHRTRDAVQRLVMAGGRVIGSSPIDATVPDPVAVARSLHPLRLVEASYAIRAGHGWTLSRERDDDAELVLWVAVKE